jgi:hypothetical protein
MICSLGEHATEVRVAEDEKGRAFGAPVTLIFKISVRV